MCAVDFAVSRQPLGTDRTGRQYLVFRADPLSVYVQPTTADKSQGLAREHRGGDEDVGGGGGAGGAGGIAADADDQVWKVNHISE